MSKDQKIKKLSILKIGSMSISNQTVSTISRPSSNIDDEVTLLASRPLRNHHPSLRMKMEQLRQASEEFENK